MWVINRIDKIRRDFLWGKNATSSRGVHLINWQTVCIPRQWGGMGVKDLEVHNKALMMRWWWRAHKEPDSLLTSVMVTLYSSPHHTNGPPFWKKQGSFFWRQLHTIRPLFQLSTKYIVNGGNSISFWYDPWAGPPLVLDSDRPPRPIRQRISLRMAAESTDIVLPRPRTEMQEQAAEALTNLVFNEGEDELIWKWTASGTYTANSFYNFFAGLGRVRSPLSKLWKTKAPPTVRIFFYLLLHDKLLTQQVMNRRKLQHTMTTCVMCRNCPVESALHLFFLCPFAVSVWHRLEQKYQFWLATPELSLMLTATRNLDRTKEVTPSKLSQWYTTIMATCWHLWKQRNIFAFEVQLQAPRIPPAILVNRVCEDVKLWTKYC